MGDVLANWRGIPQWGLFLVFVPIVAYTVLHHPDFADGRGLGPARPRRPGLGRPAQPADRADRPDQAPAGRADGRVRGGHARGRDRLQRDLPPLLGQHLHPGRRHAPPEEAVRPGRAHQAPELSILGVAVFIFVFSLLFQQSEYIFLFFAITGAIFAGGSGAVIIGGLYWKRGTTAAAWSAMIVGAVIAVGGIVIQQLVPGLPHQRPDVLGPGHGPVERRLHRRLAPDGPRQGLRHGQDAPPGRIPGQGGIHRRSTRSRSRAGRSWAWAGSSPAGTRSSTSRPTPGRPAGSSSSSSARSST